ncbi:hypothetical protein, partial [Ruminococcus sp.]|uniref:hypothetical protein n=1 Tax=Ruminococcus sp. TaxID=41978 RepID=UPI003A9710A5
FKQNFLQPSQVEICKLQELTKYFKKPIMPMSFSVIYLLVLIAVLLVFGGIAIGKFNYDNVTEVAS